MADALATRQKELDGIMEEVERMQAFYDEVDPETKRKRRWDPDDRTKFDRLCDEGFQIQQEIESEQKAAALETNNRRLREVPEPTLPNARSQIREKSGAGDREVAGYISIGDMVIQSQEYRKFAQDNYARGVWAIVQIPCTLVGKNAIRGFNGEALAPLTRDQRKAYEQFLQTKEMKLK